MTSPVQEHYQCHPYPHYPLSASVRRCDTYALNLNALWCRFNGTLPPADAKKILLAGCGTFSPYPWSLANPDSVITALDFSERSLKRARLHCLLHGLTNVTYQWGDLLNGSSHGAGFGLIDSYGVLHHLDDPLAGFRALESQLSAGGILRIMVYSRYARKDEESIRRALRLLKIGDPAAARSLLAGAREGSRLARYLAATDETDTAAGIADALLHPKVHTFRIDDLLDLIRQTGLQPLLFAHQDARADVQEEIKRLRRLEKERISPGNFVLYLGKGEGRRHGGGNSSMIVLNPCLKTAVSRFRCGTLDIPGRIGMENPPLGRSERAFLRQFTTPVPGNRLTPDAAEAVEMYKRLLFLVEYS